MKTLKSIEKEINNLLKEAELIIIESKGGKTTLAFSMLIYLKKQVKDQFINIRGYLK